MPLSAFFLRCMLVLALVAGGVPTPGMAGMAGMPGMASAAGVQAQADGMTGCHDPEIAESQATAAAAPSDCCGSTDCLCGCLHHMPAASLVLPLLAAPVFASALPGQRSFERATRVPPATLRPPIG